MSARMNQMSTSDGWDAPIAVARLAKVEYAKIYERLEAKHLGKYVAIAPDHPGEYAVGGSSDAALVALREKWPACRACTFRVGF